MFPVMIFYSLHRKLKKNDILSVEALNIKEGETSPPKRYNSGSMILAMENAGQLIEDEELRAQIRKRYWHKRYQGGNTEKAFYH